MELIRLLFVLSILISLALSSGSNGSGSPPITINCNKNGEMSLNSSEEILVLSPSTCTKNSTSDKTKAVFTNCFNKTVTVMLMKTIGSESITDTEYSVICQLNVVSGKTFTVTGQLLHISTMKPISENGSANTVHFEMTFTKNGNKNLVSANDYVTLGDVLIMKISTRGINPAGWKLIPNTCTAYPENAKSQHKLDLIKSGNCPEPEADGLISPFEWSTSNKLELKSEVKVFEFKEKQAILNTLVFECKVIICDNQDKQTVCQTDVNVKATSCKNNKLQVRRRRDTDLLKGKPDSAATHTVTGVLRIHNAVVNEVMSGSVKLEMSVNLICLVHLCLALLYMKDQN